VDRKSVGVLLLAILFLSFIVASRIPAVRNMALPLPFQALEPARAN
jgi:hypothetical protein